jgi:RNA-directed DNA polymerase
MDKAKPYCISKKGVMEAWKKVKGNKGTYGVDEESIEDFSLNLKGNLYKLWNRMSSGTYFPPAVRAVEIPKTDGSKRLLGIPTVTDRVAQAVVKASLEEKVEKQFHEDSYGYRPGKSALEAVGKARERCWKQDWCIDLDIKGFFDNLNHALVLRAIKKHTEEEWIHLYVGRWLKSPIQLEGGELKTRESGTPQGGVISPLLANLFMHHAFDEWITKGYPEVKFERYADDVLVHCSSYGQAQKVLEAIKDRLKKCGLEINPEKTKIVYCKDERRKGNYENESFDYLGYTFRPRVVRSKAGDKFVGFTPAISRRAMKGIREEVRGWRLHQWSEGSMRDLAKKINPQVRGWINYYGRYYKGGLNPLIDGVNQCLIRWAMKKYKSLRRCKTRAGNWLKEVRKREPVLFAHWGLSLKTMVG